MKQARESESKQVREGEGDRERKRERERTHECLEQVGGLTEDGRSKLVWKRAGRNESLVSAHFIS